MPLFHLRPATDSDLALTYEITKEAMGQYVVQTWGDWNDDEQREKHRANFNPSTLRIVVSAGTEVGLIVVEEEASYLWLVKLYLRRSYQGAGLGSELLRQVVGEAAELGKPVRLRVLRVNVAAQRLYLRHGFQVTGEEPERVFMVRGTSEA